MKIIAAADKKPGCIVILGDNFYPAGVTDPEAKEFLTHFYEIYRNKKYEALNKIPIFLILGNHCVNLSLFGDREGVFDKARAYAQVAHTHLKCETPQMYFADTLDLAKLPPWNMPRPCYALLTEGNVEKEEGALLELFINWNTIIHDYLTSLEAEKNNPNNQANFLRNTVKALHEKYKDRLVTYVYSHGPRTVHDKGLTDDPRNKLGLYLPDSEMEQLKKLGFKGQNTNEIFGEVLDRLGVYEDVVYAADTHALYNFLRPTDGDDRRVYQVGTGGGGNPNLEDRCDFKHPNQLWYMQQHGFVMTQLNLSDPRKIIENQFFTTTGLRLQFTQRQEFPICVTLSDEAKQLREVIAVAYVKYSSGANPGVKGAKDADDLRNEFHQASLLKLGEARDFLRKFFDMKNSGWSNSALLVCIDEQMQKTFGMKTEAYLKKYAPPVEKKQDSAEASSAVTSNPPAESSYNPFAFVRRLSNAMSSSVQVAPSTTGKKSSSPSPKL